MMSLGSTGSVLPRRALGRQLQMFRERAQMSRSAAGKVLGVSVQTMTRLEEGQRTKVTDLYINTLADLYRVSNDDRRVLLGLAVEVRTSPVLDGGWWRAYPSVGSVGFDHFLSLETSACEVFLWQSALVPGILQTREYRRALAWSKFPDSPGDEIDGMLNLAERRQKRIHDTDFRIEAVISEAAVCHRVGSSAVMIDQLSHLLELSDLPNVSVRLVPFRASGELGLYAGQFVLFRFPSMPATKITPLPIAYVEGYTGDVYIEHDPQLSHYIRAVERLRRVGLDALASKEKLHVAAEEWDR